MDEDRPYWNMEMEPYSTHRKCARYKLKKAEGVSEAALRRRSLL